MLPFPRSLLAIAFIIPFVSSGQTSRVQTAPPHRSAKSKASKPAGLTPDSIIEMVQAGISDDVIIVRLREENKPFELSADEMIRLKKGHVSDNVMKVMLNPRAEISAAPPAPAAAPAQSPVVIPVPVTTIPVSRPSGATPIANAASGDPDDPMTSHDSGIYLYTKDREDRPRMIVLERAAYQGAKTGGIFTSAMTYGMKKMKTKAILPGAAASIRTSEASPVFYFYFEDKAAGLGKSYFGINSLSNPNQFALIRLEVHKSNRETIIGEFGVFGASSGTNEKAMVTFKSERVRTGLYRVTPNQPLQPGEYCFLASSGVMGAYGAGAAGAMDIFDFGINGSQ